MRLRQRDATVVIGTAYGSGAAGRGAGDGGGDRPQPAPRYASRCGAGTGAATCACCAPAPATRVVDMPPDADPLRRVWVVRWRPSRGRRARGRGGLPPTSGIPASPGRLRPATPIFERRRVPPGPRQSQPPVAAAAVRSPRNGSGRAAVFPDRRLVRRALVHCLRAALPRQTVVRKQHYTVDGKPRFCFPVIKPYSSPDRLPKPGRTPRLCSSAGTAPPLPGIHNE